ncbi:hypothetical protein ACNKHW_03255 [Shigella flexneri]
MSIEILTNEQAFDQPTLIQHAERLKMLIAQFAADPALLCGDVDIMLPGEYAQLAAEHQLRLRFQKPRLARWWQNKRQKPRMLRRWRECAFAAQLSGNAEQVVALANPYVSAALNGGTAWRWHYRARSFWPSHSMR